MTPGTSLVAQMVKNLLAMQEIWVWSLGQEDPLEKGMTIHFSILAWRIPWPEESGRLQSTGSQRVRHGWAAIIRRQAVTLHKYIKPSVVGGIVPPSMTCWSLNPPSGFPGGSDGSVAETSLHQSGFPGGSDGSVAESSTWETKHHTQRVGELRFIIPVGPEELTLQALSPEQRDYRVFINRL